MLLARVCRCTLAPGSQSLFKLPSVTKPQLTKIQAVRLFADDGRSTFTRAARRRATITEQAMAPAGESAFKLGQGAVAGGAAIGIGALCFYGLGLSSSVGAIDKTGLWPQYVKDRIHATYAYFGASILVSATAAAMCLTSPTIMNMIMRQGLVSVFVSMAAVVGSGMAVQMIPYKEGLGAKQLAWLMHTGLMGAFLAPLSFLGGPLLIRAAWYTAGVVGGLSAIAACAPSDKFLYMGGPLAMGLGVVFCSSIGSMFLPPTTALGAGLYSVSLYGGLILFSMFLLYDTQLIIKKAETQPAYENTIAPFDPINNAIHIYLDTINIFIRIATILSGGGNRRK